MASNFEIGESSSLNGSDHDCDIPPGFRFCPSDEEVMHILKAKLKNDSEYYSHIPEVDVYEYSPKQLADAYKLNEENEGYFFTRRSKKYPNGTRPTRSAGNGTWTPSTGRNITNKKGETIGHVATLGYHEGNSKKIIYREGSCRDQPIKWLMQEYTFGNDTKKFHELVVVKIYKKMGANKDSTIVKNVPQINSAMQLNNGVASESDPELVTWTPTWPSADPELLQGQYAYGQQFPDQIESFTWTSGANQLVPPYAQSPSIGCSDMGQLPDQQLQLDQEQSFLQTPDPIQNAFQPVSINCLDNHSAQMGPSPDQYYHQHYLDQNQPFLQPTEEVAQSASVRWFDSHSAEMGQFQAQHYPYKANCLQQFTAQDQYVSCTPAAPATQSLPMNYLYENDDVSFINKDPNFGPYGNQAIVAPGESYAAAPQQSSEQFSTDKNNLSSDDLKNPFEWYNCGFNSSTSGDQYFHKPLKGDGKGECANFMPWKCNK